MTFFTNVLYKILFKVILAVACETAPKLFKEKRVKSFQIFFQNKRKIEKNLIHSIRQTFLHIVCFKVLENDKNLD